MLKKIDSETLKLMQAIIDTYSEADYLEVRKAVDALDIGKNTIVPAEAMNTACALRWLMYNPADFGRNGKVSEFEYRVDCWLENGRKYCHWRELVARKTGKADANRNEEHKTGAGDWLRSQRYCEFEDILDEYAKKQTYIVWRTDYFAIRCRWCELFDYLASYNGNIATWFNRCLKYGDAEVVVKLQEWKTSKKKIAFLQACPYNED